MVTTTSSIPLALMMFALSVLGWWVLERVRVHV
jgi:hypothetical protein